VNDPHNLRRFIDAQDGIYERALAELRAGAKQSHWMWFIFPQLGGLGHSPTAQFYAISSRDEGRAYLHHPLLGARLRETIDAVMPVAASRSAEQVFGEIDAMKLKSSLTLFDQLEPNSCFAAALAAFFRGARDPRTLALLNAPR
jgi:uncharacterized protein (DUF1810 family)